MTKVILNKNTLVVEKALRETARNNSMPNMAMTPAVGDRMIDDLDLPEVVFDETNWGALRLTSFWSWHPIPAPTPTPQVNVRGKGGGEGKLTASLRAMSLFS